MKPNNKNKAPVRILIIIVGCLAITAVILFNISKSRNFQFFGEMITDVQTSEKRIALTFDDGDERVAFISHRSYTADTQLA